jgi:polyisoprenoid-binding protein YceI
MTIEAGTYSVGPNDGALTVRTARRGAIAKAGHDLLIEVGHWGATVELAADPAQSVLELTADSNSLKVLKGTGGIQSLSDKDTAGIEQTIEQEVLKGTAITFRSTSVQPSGEGRFSVKGDLELAGGNNPVGFDLEIGDDGHLTGSAVVRQSAWGMKPYTAMFGALKVADEVQVAIDARLQPAGR